MKGGALWICNAKKKNMIEKTMSGDIYPSQVCGSRLKNKVTISSWHSFHCLLHFQILQIFCWLLSYLTSRWSPGGKSMGTVCVFLWKWTFSGYPNFSEKLSDKAISWLIRNYVMGRKLDEVVIYKWQSAALWEIYI